MALDMKILDLTLFFPGHQTCDDNLKNISQMIGQLGQIGQMNCGVFPVEMSARFLSLCDPRTTKSLILYGPISNNKIENMDKEFTAPKLVLIVWLKIPGFQ